MFWLRNKFGTQTELTCHHQAEREKCNSTHVLSTLRCFFAFGSGISTPIAFDSMLIRICRDAFKACWSSDFRNGTKGKHNETLQFIHRRQRCEPSENRRKASLSRHRVKSRKQRRTEHCCKRPSVKETRLFSRCCVVLNLAIDPTCIC